MSQFLLGNVVRKLLNVFPQASSFRSAMTYKLCMCHNNSPLWHLNLLFQIGLSIVSFHILHRAIEHLFEINVN